MCSFTLIIMRIQSNSVLSQDSGAFTTDPVLNTVVGAGACAVATACVGGVILNAAAGSILGTVYYAGLATMAGGTAYGALSDNGISAA